MGAQMSPGEVIEKLTSYLNTHIIIIHPSHQKDWESYSIPSGVRVEFPDAISLMYLAAMMGCDYEDKKFWNPEHIYLVPRGGPLDNPSGTSLCAGYGDGFGFGDGYGDGKKGYGSGYGTGSGERW